MPRHLESKNVSREKRSGAGAHGGTSVDWGLCCVICRNRRIAPVDYKSLEHGQAGDKRRIECASIGQAIWIWIGATRRRRLRIDAAHATRWAATKRHRKKGRLERKLVHGAHVFAHIVNPEARTNRCCMVTEEVISQSDAWSISGRIIVVVGRTLGVPAQSSEVQALYAGGVYEWKLPLIGESGVQVPNVARIVVETSEDLCSQAKIQRQIVPDLPIVLLENPVIVGAVLVVIHTTAPKTELRCPQQEILKVSCRSCERAVRRGVRENQFAIEHLRKELVEIHARELAAEAEQVCALYPTYGVYKVVVVLRLVLIPKRRRSDFKPGAGKNKFVYGLGHGSGRPEDADVTGCHRVDVVQLIVDVHEAKAKFVHQRRRKEMRFRGVEETCGHRCVEREIQRRRADAAGQRAAERFLEVASSKR